MPQGRLGQAQHTGGRHHRPPRLAAPRVHHPAVQATLAAIKPALGRRTSPYTVRTGKQAALLKLPAYPTTTIGSFPQTTEIRRARNRFKSGALD